MNKNHIKKFNESTEDTDIKATAEDILRGCRRYEIGGYSGSGIQQVVLLDDAVHAIYTFLRYNK
jgi:hypothetical protein